MLGRVRKLGGRVILKISHSAVSNGVTRENKSMADVKQEIEKGLKDARDGLRPARKSEAYLDGYSDGSKVNLS